MDKNNPNQIIVDILEAVLVTPFGHWEARGFEFTRDNERVLVSYPDGDQQIYQIPVYSGMIAPVE
jgi:hypothetical protein